MAGLKDVAALAGVSVSVASRALTHDANARISAETRARIHKVAAELNYVPDHRARALRLSRAGAIALVVPEVNNAIFGPLHEGVTRACERRETVVLLGQIDASDLGHATLAQLIGNGRVDGVVIQRAEEYDDTSLAAMLQVDLPVVLFNSRLEGHCGSVALDDRAAVRTALGHLRELGHRRVGFIAGAPHHDAAARRLAAFREASAEWGLDVQEPWIQPGGWEAPAGAEAITRLLALGDRPTGIVVASVNAAVGALATAVAAGVKVPQELSIVSVQDAWIARYTTPPLTTVALPMAESGERAAAMLLDHLEGAPLEDVVVGEPAPRLLVRSSAAPPVG